MNLFLVQQKCFAQNGSPNGSSTDDNVWTGGLWPRCLLDKQNQSSTFIRNLINQVLFTGERTTSLVTPQSPLPSGRVSRSWLFQQSASDQRLPPCYQLAFLPSCCSLLQWDSSKWIPEINFFLPPIDWSSLLVLLHSCAHYRPSILNDRLAIFFIYCLRNHF